MSATIPPAYLAHLDAVTGPDPASVRQFWVPDGRLEFPYATSLGSPGLLEGVDAIVGYFDGLRTFRDWSFDGMRAWRIEGEADEYVLETHGSAVVIATGKRYEQDYVVRFGLAPDGRLAWMREFWDPTRA